MEVGGIALLNYGEVPLTWRTRLLLAHTQGSSWVIATPDFDIYEEDMSLSNSNLSDFYYCGPLGAIPARIPAASVYGFAPMGPDRLGELMQQGRVHAAGIRAHLPGIQLLLQFRFQVSWDMVLRLVELLWWLPFLLWCLWLVLVVVAG